MKLIALLSLLLLSPTVVSRLSFDNTQERPIDEIEDMTPVEGDSIDIDRSDPNSNTSCNSRLNCQTCLRDSKCYWWADTQFCEQVRTTRADPDVSEQRAIIQSLTSPGHFSFFRVVE